MNSYPIPPISNIIKKRGKNIRGGTRPKPSKKNQKSEKNRKEEQKNNKDNRLRIKVFLI